MTPEQIKRAAEILAALKGLRQLLNENVNAEGAYLDFPAEVSDSGHSGGVGTYLPVDIARDMAWHAVEQIETELRELGVDPLPLPPARSTGT